MKKTLPIILVIVVLVALGSFYGGIKYQSVKAPGRGQFAFGQGNFNNLSEADRERFQEMGARRMDAGQNNLAFVNGEIINQDTQSLTIKLRDGGSKIILYSDSTTIGKMATGTKADLTLGTNIMVTGKSTPDGSLTAETIQIRSGSELPPPSGPLPSPGQ